MTGQMLISHSPEDRETAAFLAGDLERQGVRARAVAPGDEQAVYGAAGVIALASHASAASGAVWGDADRAARAGKPLYVVRVGDVDAQAFSTMPVRQWVDAFGPQAAANVARLADDLRGVQAGAGVAPGMGYAPAHDPYGAPPQPYGARAGGGVPKWVPIVGIVVGVATMIGGVLKIAGAFDSTPSRTVSSYSPSSGTGGNMSGGYGTGGSNMTMPSSSTTNSRLSMGLSQAASQFRARLPMTSGPTTITDVQASGNTMTMYVTLSQPVGGLWSQMDSALRSNICSGGFASLIRQGATAVVQMQDSVGSRHSLTVSSC